MALAIIFNTSLNRMLVVGFWIAGLLFSQILVAHEGGNASLHMNKQKALEEIAFPASDHIERRTLFLEQNELETLSSAAHSKFESRLQTVYVGWKENSILGYAIIDTDIVRSKAATYIAILNPKGDLRDIRILAWQEPPEYEPPQRWLDRFIGRQFEQSALQVGTDIDSISGATISTRMITEHMRRTLAIFEIILKEQEF